MSTNSAIAFFQNEQIVNPGIASSKGDEPTYTDGDSFESYFNRALTSTPPEKKESNPIRSESKTVPNGNAVSHKEKTHVNTSQSEPTKKNNDNEESFEFVEIPEDCITIDENGKVQIDIDSLSETLKEKLGIEDEDSGDIKVVFLTEEQAAALLNGESVSSDDIEKELELNKAEQKLFAQQRLFFAQSRHSEENNKISKQDQSIKTDPNVKQTETLKNVSSVLEEANADVKLNEAESPQLIMNTDDAKDAASVFEIHNIETDLRLQTDKLIEKSNVNEVKKQIDSTNNENKNLENAVTKETNNSDSIVQKILDSIDSEKDEEKNSTEEESVLESKKHKLIDNADSSKTSGECSDAAANTAHTERVPQGPDVDSPSDTKDAKPNAPEIPKGVFVIQTKEKDSEGEEKPQKVILLARPASEAKETKGDSAQTGKDRSNNDQAKKDNSNSESLKETTRPAESTRLKAMTDRDEKLERQTKTDSSLKNSINAPDKETKSTESRKLDATVLQQSFKNDRDASVLEATNNPRPAQPVQTNAQPEQTNAQNQTVAQTTSTSQPTAASSTPGQQTSQTSMVQHYAEKVAEVQEAAAKQIVRGVQGSIGSERSHVTLRLTPESLGRVHIQMTMENGVLSAQISANKDSTRALLQQSMNSLKASFEESGIKVDRLVVNKDSLDLKQNDLGRQNESQDRSAKNQSGHDHRSGFNRQNQNGKPSKQQYSSWSDRMSTQDYFM